MYHGSMSNTIEAHVTLKDFDMPGACPRGRLLTADTMKLESGTGLIRFR